ncbi:hypothetical protein [Streptomyces sp. NRRL S-37]|uniref:hypothetical protein n=1 Tax=Streptomyces sp. NRRL S-37 TaxID=1463903 RepID=UPI0007C5C323|nr:hypothetical protein [Streptomyces sp. NRRL S-37]
MSDELADALRELAAQHEVPPRVGAAEVRDRARRRSRRRRASAALGTAAAAACALTAVAFTLHTGDPDPDGRPPAAAPEAPAPSAATPAPTPSPALAGVLDLGRHTLTFGERVLRVESHAFPRFPSGSRMTVVAKDDVRTLRLENGVKPGTEVKIPYLVELRTSGRQPVYAGAPAFDMKELATLSEGTGWLGMSATDAKWFHARVREGDRVEITSTVTPDAGATATAPARAETTAGAPETTDRTGTPGTAGGTDD